MYVARGALGSRSQWPPPPHLRGLGANTSALIGSGVSVALATAAPFTGPAAPFVAAAAAIVPLVASLFAGCGQTCIEATNIVNQVAPLLEQNLALYLQQPIHYVSIQKAALANFDQAWGYVTQNCGNPALGAAGRRCISDRAAGGCAWKTAAPSQWVKNSAGVWTFEGAGNADPNGTYCWNWFSGMRDPIANDPTVVPDPPAAAALPGSTGAGLLASLPRGLPILPILLIGGGLVLLSMGKK